MKHPVRQRILLASGVAALAIAVAVVATLHAGTLALERQIEQALGPESEVGAISVGWSAVELRDIVIRAPRGWPAAEALRAQRVTVHPDLFALLSARVHIPRVTIDHAYLSVRRGADGRMRLLPGLLEPGASRASSSSGVPDRPLGIGKVELRHGVLEFFDETVRRPAHKIRIEQLHATIEDLRLPEPDTRTAIRLDGALKGTRRDGRLLVDGWAEFGGRNADFATKLQGVDLAVLQPYLFAATETGMRDGALDLRLKSAVRDNRLHAPGSVALAGLDLAPADGDSATFMGLPRAAAMAGLQQRKGRISVDFTLEGRLDDPRYSLNESLATAIRPALAEALGIRAGDGGRAGGGAADGMGGVVRKLFGR